MKRVIVSGYFNPLHCGHLDMIEDAAKLGDKLIVVVNNDAQQLLKKGKIILSEQDRARVVSAIRDVDEVMIATDTDPTVRETMKAIRAKYPDDELVFANGGDRDGYRTVPESDVCRELDIVMEFGVGSHEVIKRDSSTRINQELDREARLI